ncbi:MAG: hypothetical protein ACE5GL_03340, partial [Calditrichia bacterium]
MNRTHLKKLVLLYSSVRQILPARFVIIILAFMLCNSHSLLGQRQESMDYKKYSTGRFVEILKPFQSGDYAVGIQAKGKLADVITNFGQIANFHVFAPALEWPAFGEGQDDEQQYGWGVDFMIGIDGDVIESFLDPASNIISREWQPVDENLYSGNVTVSETDQTPIMATSDNVETWPIGAGGDPFWPGLFRRDSSGTVFKGEFTSERDLFCIFDDKGNETQYGLRVEQTAYSFTRSYAEDFLVYRFNVKNTSTDTLRDIYPGMMVQFLIDFDNFDLINFIDSNDDGRRDLIYMWDSDGIPQEPWSKVGYISYLVVSSPANNGITNFHFFHDEFTPSEDEEFWRLLTSDTLGLPDTIKARYFHGDDVRIDDVSLAPQLDPDGLGRGGEITWTYSMGPVSIAPADSVAWEIAIVLGDDEQDLLKNVDWVWFLANNNWNGSNPPESPEVETYAGDGQVTVTWDSDRSENSRDNVNGTRDFEGYKVYRSIDHGKTWGKIITNSVGDFVGFKPLAQFDLINGITGNDPISGKYLGNDTGIKHTFVDTTVSNGIEYWYTVTAYDRGDSLNKVESLESSLGLTVDEINVSAATPGKKPSNLNPGMVEGGNVLKPVEGITGAEVFVEIIDVTELKDRTYQITFREDTPVIENNDTTEFITTFTLTDANSGEILLFEHPLTDESGDNIPVIDGFRLSLIDIESGISSIGWTKVLGDTSTFDWYTEKRTNSNQEIGEEIAGIEDFKIVVVDTSEGSNVVLTDGVFGHIIHSYIKIPIKVFLVTDPDNPVDVSKYTEVFDLRVQFPTSSLLGPLGWDLIPGGAGYNPIFGEVWPDIIALNSDSLWTSHIWLKTQNGPDTAKAPSVGDEFTIKTVKSLNNNVVYRFTTKASAFSETSENELKNVKVVPNPFFVTSAFSDRVMFTNLPDRCKIKIFNVSGDLIRSLEHNDNSGSAYWDLKNDAGLAVAYGLYIYVIETENGNK